MHSKNFARFLTLLVLFLVVFSAYTDAEDNETAPSTNIPLELWSFDAPEGINYPFLNDSGYLKLARLPFPHSGKWELPPEAASSKLGVTVFTVPSADEAREIVSRLGEIKPAGIELNFTFFGKTIERDTLTQLLSLPSLEFVELNFLRAMNVPAWAMEVAAAMPNLKSLSLDSSLAIEAGALQPLIDKKNSKLETLKITTGNIPLDSICEITCLKNISLFSLLPNHPELNLSNLENLTDLESLEIHGAPICYSPIPPTENLESLRRLAVTPDATGFIPPGFLENLISQPKLEELGVFVYSNEDIAAIASCKKLKKLKLTIRSRTELNLAPFSSLTKLKALSIESGYLQHDFGTIPSGAFTLDELELYGDLSSFGADEKGLLEFLEVKHLLLDPYSKVKSNLGTLLGQLPKLLSIRIPQGIATDDFVEGLSATESLTSLYLGGKYLTNKAANAVSKISTLTSLSLDTFNMPDDAIKHISTLPNLKYLALLNNYFLTPASLTHVNQIKNLRSLILGGLLPDDKLLPTGSPDSLRYFTNISDASVNTINAREQGFLQSVAMVFPRALKMTGNRYPRNGSLPGIFAPACNGFSTSWFSNSSDDTTDDATSYVILRLPVFYRAGVNGFYVDENGLVWMTKIKNSDQLEQLRKLTTEEINFAEKELARILIDGIEFKPAKRGW